MPNMSIRARLIALVAFLAIALVIAGGIGFYIARSTEANTQSIYEHQTVPMRELARIRRLVVENSGQIFRAVQHNPAFDYAKLHDHPVGSHLDVVEKNLKWMDETFAAMGDIAVEVKRVGATITELGEHSERISSVVQVIKDVADQTNLLALNAAIEAARAGEQGRGFAVVADEVRKLAERTTKATGEIAGMIQDIQQRSKSAVVAMENTIGRLESGSELAAKAGQAIAEIRNANGEVQRVFADIDVAMHEQGAASHDIAQKVERVARASEESSAAVDVSAREASNIRNLANDMRANVERFRI